MQTTDQEHTCFMAPHFCSTILKKNNTENLKTFKGLNTKKKNFLDTFFPECLSFLTISQAHKWLHQPNWSEEAFLLHQATVRNQFEVQREKGAPGLQKGQSWSRILSSVDLNPRPARKGRHFWYCQELALLHFCTVLSYLRHFCLPTCLLLPLSRSKGKNSLSIKDSQDFNLTQIIHRGGRNDSCPVCISCQSIWWRGCSCELARNFIQTHICFLQPSIQTTFQKSTGDLHKGLVYK